MNTFRLLAAGLLSSGVALSQGIPRPPTPIPSPPLPGPGAQAQFPLDPCVNAGNLLRTLTLEPATIYPGDQVTLRWDASDPRGLAWDGSVRLRSSFPVSPALPDPARKSGSHTFRAPENPLRGTFTIETIQGLCRKTKTIEYARVPSPSISSIDPARGSSGADLVIRGSEFGQQQGQVRLTVAGQTVDLAPSHWGPTSLHAAVPNGAPTGAGTVRVVRGGRLESNGIAFRVVRSITLNNALVQGAAAAVGLPQTAIRLTDGANASSVTFSPAMLQLGASNATMTLPDFEVNVPRGEKIAQTVLLPLSGFPEKVHYFVNHFDSNDVGASVSNGQLVLSVGFESGGPEIKGKVLYCDLGAFGACASNHWADGLAPDIQIDGARVTLRLNPGVAGGALTFPTATDSFEANVQIGSDIADWLVGQLGNYRGRLKTAIGNGIHNGLNTPAVRGAIASRLNSTLRSLGVNQILSVSTAGGNITVEYE